MLKLILVLTLLLSLTSCRSASVKPENQEAPRMEGSIPSGGRWAEGRGVSGWNVFVELENKSQELTQKNLLLELKKETESQLQALGFKLVPGKVDAHVFIRMSYSEVSFATAFPFENVGPLPPETEKGDAPAEQIPTSSQRSVQVLMDGKFYSLRSEQNEKVGDYYLTVYAQNYGERPQDIYWMRQRGLVGSEALRKAIEESTKAWITGLETLKSRVQEHKQAGPPGCLPRLGFAVEPVSINGQLKYQVTTVDKKSPAHRAGVRVGDFVLEVDSHSYGEFSKKPEFNKAAYKDLKKVPLKLLRGKSEIVTQIQAQMVCQ